MSTTREVLTFTTGVMGAGKSYRRGPVFLTTEFLPKRTGEHVSNLPLDAEAIGQHVARRHPKREREQRAAEYASRIVTIPREVLKTWEHGDSYPDDYFRDKDLRGAHVAIDEIHNYCGKKHPAHHRRRWSEWIGELRHQGITLELITQHRDRVAPELVDIAAIQISIVPVDHERDPVLDCKLGDWLQLIGKARGGFVPMSRQITRINEDGRWVVKESQTFWIEPELCKLYDSFNAPEKGGTHGKGEPEPCESMSWPGLLLWFIQRNAISLTTRTILIVAVLWLAFFGGAGFLIGGTIGYLREGLTAGFVNTATVATPPKDTTQQPTQQIRHQQPTANPDAITQQHITQEQTPPTITAIGPGYAILESGERLAPGQFVLVEGNWIQCTEINHATRSVLLDDGTVLRVGNRSSVQLVTDTPPKSDPDPQRLLPTSIQRAQPSNPDRSPDAARNPKGGPIPPR
ncbi:MAG: hypothetical protein Tsb0013_02530 [Phycisphaerales bacterium]